MKQLVFVTITHALGFLALAQTSKESANNSPALYYYPKFEKAFVQFTDGSTTAGMLNYNLLFEEMHFLAKNGDTLALDKEAAIRQITIANDHFFYDHGFLKSSGVYEGIMIATKQQRAAEIKVARGAYGESTTGAAVSQYISLTGIDQTFFRLKEREAGYGDLQTDTYIACNDRLFLPATKKSFLKLFPSRKSAIQQYFSTKASTLSEMEVRALIQLCIGNE